MKVINTRDKITGGQNGRNAMKEGELMLRAATILLDLKKETKETYRSCTPDGVSLIPTPRGSNS